jgi:hypothetical protein
MELEYPEKPTDLPDVTDKLYHNVVSSKATTLRMKTKIYTVKHNSKYWIQYNKDTIQQRYNTTKIQHNKDTIQQRYKPTKIQYNKDTIQQRVVSSTHRHEQGSSHPLCNCIFGVCIVALYLGICCAV